MIYITVRLYLTGAMIYFGLMQQTISKHVYRLLLVFAFSTVAVGTIVYHLVEKWSWLNSYYFSVVTLATVGYGDITPHTSFGKIFTTFYIFVGVGIVTTFITFTMRRRAQRMEKRHRSK